VTVTVSALGLLFAAIAAWKAAEAVSVTREIQREANTRRVLDALTSIIHAALALERAADDEESVRPERREQFQAAQLELMRAGSLPFIISGPEGDISELPRLLSSLTAYDNDIWTRPQEAIDAAARAAELFRFRPPPKPKWSRRVMDLVRKRR